MYVCILTHASLLCREDGVPKYQPMGQHLSKSSKGDICATLIPQGDAGEEQRCVGVQPQSAGQRDMERGRETEAQARKESGQRHKLIKAKALLEKANSGCLFLPWLVLMLLPSVCFCGFSQAH